MRVSRLQIENGLVGWNPSATSNALVMLDGADLDDAIVVTNPAGTPLPRTFTDKFRFAFPTQPNAVVSPFPAWAMRLDPDGSIRTRIWDVAPNGDSVQVTLAHVPSYGHFHRVVVAPENTQWEQDTMLYFGGSWIRFINGTVVGEVAPPSDTVTVIDGGFEITGPSLGTQTLEGRFIEIVAQGDNENEARRNAEGLRGVTALLFGDKTNGEVKIENAYSVLRGSGQSSFLTTRASAIPGFVLNDDAFATLDRIVSGGIDSGRLNKHVMLALHWYRRGSQAQSDIDAFMSYYIGIETLIKGFSKTNGPVPAAAKRKNDWSPVLKKYLSTAMPPELLENIISKLGSPSVKEEVAEYARIRLMPDDKVKVIATLGRKRNDLVHGDSAGITLDDVIEARRLLIAMLKAELAIEHLIPVENSNFVLDLHLPFTYTEYGWTSD